MRIDYTGVTPEVWAAFYTKQAGGGFVGIPYQRGGGLGNFFRGLFRFLLPVVAKAGKAIGKEALSAGSRIASDVVAGEDFVDSAKRNLRESTALLLNKGAENLQKGGRLGKRPSAKRGKPKAPPTKRRRKSIKRMNIHDIFTK
jgi:hypothetical protein